jgi:hypothetical protein
VSTDRLNEFQTSLPTIHQNTQNPSPSSTTSANDTYPPISHYDNEVWLDLEPQPLIATRFSESWSMGDALIEYATARELFEQYVSLTRGNGSGHILNFLKALKNSIFLICQF